ncbi:hypothetical protein QYE76_010863 [Lolium multiflorum]|uniref:Reverse transcriptase domain-containing protein n=1 Tax=Lolium multiflorum TaxID=4521 RepID=A0AAD8TVV6_LOLMU|nr:hypothetical protein QYE76_010863 [Lolium multiflorum]
MFKMQLDAFIGMGQEIKELTNSIKVNLVINEANEKQLPAQPERNPKAQCGAVTSVDAVVTRSGASANPVLPTPSTISRAYVPPARRINERETDASPEIETVGEKPNVQERKETEEIHNESVRIPFTERLEKPKDEKQFAKFLEVMKDVQVTIPILDAVMHVPMYAKFFKELLTKKRSIEEPEIVTLSKECSAIIQNALPTKLDDPGSFCVPCIIGQNSFSALCDLGSSVSVLPLSVTKGMRMGDLQSTSVTLQLADRSIRKPAVILMDIPVMVGKFAYPVDFIVLDMDDRSEAVILGTPFLATAGALIDVKGAKPTLQWGKEQVMFDMRHPTHLTHQPEPCNRIDTVGSCVEDLYLYKGIIHQTEPKVENAEEFHYAVYQIASDISKQGEEPEVVLPERLPFGLCNAPGTFQRCVMSIFSSDIEKIMEVFMDDFTVYGSDFDTCLKNLRTFMRKCQKHNFVLNWEKCHFMVEQGIVLGHLVSARETSIPALLGFERRKEDGLTHAEAYVDVKNAIEDLIEACRKIAVKLSSKRARSKVIGTMSKMMAMVPDMIRDWQESSARGAAAHVLVMCKANFPTMDFVSMADLVSKATNVKKLIKEASGFDTLFSSRVNHETWYEKHDLPAGFSKEDEEDEEKGSRSSASPSGSKSGKDNTFISTEEDKPDSSS